MKEKKNMSKLKRILIESKHWLKDENRFSAINCTKLRREQNKCEIVGYSSYLRNSVEPCGVNARNADIQTMEILGISKMNPIYNFEKIKSFFDYILSR